MDMEEASELGQDPEFYDAAEKAWEAGLTRFEYKGPWYKIGPSGEGFFTEPE